MDSDRDDRGSWTFNTDKELLQGATLEVEYTYTVENESEPDYTSQTLIDLYEANIDEYSYR